MTSINQSLILRMLEHGYTDEEIASRLRYDIEYVKAIRNKQETLDEKFYLKKNKDY